jgi:hypothetical protein
LQPEEEEPPEDSNPRANNFHSGSVSSWITYSLIIDWMGMIACSTTMTLLNLWTSQSLSLTH